MSAFKRPLIVLGGGGHGRVLIDVLQQLDCSLLGLTDPDAAVQGKTFMGVPVLGHDDVIGSFAADDIYLVNGLGSTSSTAARRQVFEHWRQRGYTFASVVHPKATVAQSVTVGSGAQLLTGSIINVNASIGANTIVNSGAIVEHDCTVGQHVHLAPGVTLSGGVTVGDGCHLGTGSVVIQAVSIGEGCVIGAGAVVTASVPPYSLATGVPAKPIKRLAP